jgi:hypothetical protein
MQENNFLLIFLTKKLSFPSTFFSDGKMMLKIQQLFCQKRVGFKKIETFFPRDPIALVSSTWKVLSYRTHFFCLLVASIRPLVCAGSS